MLCIYLFFFLSRSRSGKKDSSKASSFGTSASSTSADSSNSSKTGPAGKREAKTRGMINPSSIVKYLGQDEKKVLIAKKEPEDSEKRQMLGKKNNVIPYSAKFFLRAVNFTDFTVSLQNAKMNGQLHVVTWLNYACNL